MSLFIGNPKYENLTSYNINIGKKDIDKNTIKDDIFGVEFYGMKYYTPSKDADITPHNAIKSKRIFSSKYLDFDPACVELNYTGKDEFFQYAGPFKTRLCATALDTTTGKQKVIAYKDEVSSSVWYSTYENSNKTADSATTTNPSTIYNIMVEFPKFWFCRPSKYTFLVSTKDRSSETLNGCAWHVSAMHKRKLASGGYQEYDKVYISKYANSIVKYNGDWYAVSTRSKSRVFSNNGTTKSWDCGNSNTKLYAANSGMHIFDWATWSMLWYLIFIKYNTISLRNMAFVPSKIDSTVTYEELNSTVTFEQNKPSSMMQEINVLADPGKNVWSTILGLNGYGGLKTWAQGGGVNWRGTQDATSDTAAGNGTRTSIANCSLWFTNALLPTNMWSYKSIVNNNGRGYFSQYETLSNICRGDKLPNKSWLRSIDTDLSWGDFNWSKEIANDFDRAWVLMPGYAANVGDAKAFFSGYHNFHPYSPYQYMSPIGPLFWCAGGVAGGSSRSIAYDVIPKS